jgi:oxygen-independent coproporphyrinogen-3 oxidase
MSGLYIHIPYCKQACHYCDFHFSTTQRTRQRTIAATIKEIAMRHTYLPANQPLQTIYFGGGTPSLLTNTEIDDIFEAVYAHFSVDDNAEITMEANPDDLTPNKLLDLKNTPINRLSIGIQSFINDDLLFMNRAHNATQAQNCVHHAQQAGFDNISIDLIYALPHQTQTQWQYNLEQAMNLPITHISAYCLTVEKGTALHKMIQKGTAPPTPDHTATQHFLQALDFLEKNGFEQYEISNYAKNKQYARHNSSYWNNTPYLGIGASAHSYNGTSRQHNVPHNAQYTQAIFENKIPAIIETLTPINQYNEHIMTRLRTRWGVDFLEITRLFGNDFLDILQKNLQTINPNWLQTTHNNTRLTTEGKLYADYIAAELFC